MILGKSLIRSDVAKKNLRRKVTPYDKKNKSPHATMSLTTFIPDDVLLCNLPFPLPDTTDVNTQVGSFNVKRYHPDANFCYSNKTKLNQKWQKHPDAAAGQKELALRMAHHNMSWVSPDRNEYFGDVNLWQHPVDARLPPQLCDGDFYALREVLLQEYHKRRFASGWHPNVRIWNKREELDKVQQINYKSIDLALAKQAWYEIRQKRKHYLKNK
jgi:hypothetical protein